MTMISGMSLLFSFERPSCLNTVDTKSVQPEEHLIQVTKLNAPDSETIICNAHER
jgi:hypothetical protein